MITIPGHLMGLNEYTLKCRCNKYAGAGAKRSQERIVSEAIINAIASAEQVPIDESDYPLTPTIIWYDDTRRDFDNVVFAKKFIFDALQKCGIITNDSRKYIAGVTDKLITEKENPRIEVYLTGGATNGSV